MGKDVQTEFGLHLGNLLPAQINGVTEIMPLWGFRGGYRVGDAFLESGFIGGNARGAEWINVHLSLRGDFPIEGLVGTVYAGGDGTQFKGVNTEKKIFGGGHLGGGVMAQVSTNIWFRADMKLNINPGTSLYIGFGFDFRFKGSGNGS